MQLDAERILRVASERVRLRQQWKVQVPVRLPQVLDVSDFAFIAIVDGAGPPRAGLPTRQRIAIPLGRTPQLAVGQIEEAEFSREHEIGGGLEMPGCDGHERRQETKIPCRLIARRQFVRDELLGQQAHLSRQAMRYLRAGHAPQALQIPARLLHTINV